MRQISRNRLFSDFGYYATNLLVIKSKMRGICRFGLNLPQKILYYGIPPDIRARDRRFNFVMLDRGWRECEQQGLPIRQYILKARQQGVSTAVEGYVFSKIHTRHGVNALVVAHDDEATSGIFQMTHMFYSYLPDQLKPRVKNSNVKELLFQDANGPGGLNSSMRAQTAGWKNIGRSKMLHHLHLSEVCFWPDPEAVVDGLFETVPQGPGTSIIIETTAQLLNPWGHEAWFKAKEAWLNNSIRDFDPVFLPWFILPEYASPYPPEHEFTQGDKDFKDYYGLSWKQVYWYNRKLAGFEFRHPGRGKKFMKTEYPCNDEEAWQSSGESAFPEETIELIQRHQVRNPDMVYSVGHNGVVRDANGYLKVWERPQTGVEYAIGVDTGHGLGQDYTVVCVLAHPGYRQVAEWASNSIGPREVAGIIEKIAKWYNEAVTAVETNGGSGMLTNSTLMETYGNLYRWEYFDTNSRAETKKIGWETTHRSKVMLIDYASSLFSPRLRTLIRSASIPSQMRDLRMVTYPNGAGADYRFMNHTGDHLMAWLIACMCMWRKIARYDIDDEMSGTEKKLPVDVPASTHVNSDGSIVMRDEKGIDILNGNGDNEAGSGISKSWLCQ